MPNPGWANVETSTKITPSTKDAAAAHSARRRKTPLSRRLITRERTPNTSSGI